MPISDSRAPAILTAQDLRTGRIVYWTGRGWDEQLENAALARGAAAAQEFDACAAAANAGTLVVDAFVFPVGEAGGVHPLQLRERHRLAGPSISAGPR